MRFYWYWPFARPEELGWARATVRTGEHVSVHVIDRLGAPPPEDGASVTVIRDLPDVQRTHFSTPRWVASRANTYRERERRRRAQWRSNAFDLVHLHYVNRFTDVWSPIPHPLVMSVHDVVPHVPRLGRAVEHGLLARLYGRSDGLVVHHTRLADQLRAEFGVHPSRVHVVPHQVFPVGGPPGDPPPGPLHILYFGALRPNKGVELLEEMMRATPGDVHLTIAGRGDPRLETLARAMAQRDARIHVELGFATLDRKRSLFRESSVVVLPYTSFSSQSGVLHDAYGHGRPVVVTDVGALGQTVREDGTGLVVPAGDPRSLARALTTFCEPGVWRQYAERTRRVATARSPEHVGARLREVYDSILG